MKQTFKMGLAMAVALAVNCALPANLSAATSDFLAGADMSDLAYFESSGIVYKDNGQAGDALQILKNHGLNCIRLRLFTSSAAQAQADPWDYINNLLNTSTNARTTLCGIMTGAISGNSLTLNWTAGANVHLQSAASLAPSVVWSDVPNTTGQGSATITKTNTQMFFRLTQP